MINTKESSGQEPKGNSKFITYGIDKLKINKVEIKSARANEDSKVFTLYMESPPVDNPKFVGVDGALGRTGRVQFPQSYFNINDAERMQELTDNIAIIATKFGVKEFVDKLAESTKTWEEWTEKFSQLVSGKYAWWKIVAEENFYNGKNSIKLCLPRWGFIATEAEGQAHLKFDKNNKFDFKPLDPKTDVSNADNTKMDNAEFTSEKKDDLPF